MSRASERKDSWSDQSTFVCAVCLYFVEKEGQAIGRCRRHAPVANGAGWPAVYPTDWCGDHKLIMPEKHLS